MAQTDDRDWPHPDENLKEAARELREEETREERAEYAEADLLEDAEAER